MVYKKHIKKRGVKIGPYYYTSLRLANGRVKSIYLGKFKTLKEAKARERIVLDSHKTVVQSPSHKHLLKPEPTLLETGSATPRHETRNHRPINFILLALVFIIGITIFANFGLLTSKGFTGLTVFHDDTVYVVDENRLVGRQYIEDVNDIPVGKIINSVQLRNIQEGNILNVKEITNYLSPENIEFSEVYAFNNEVKADEATFKDSAKGTIYRCEFFDYDSELCLSTWQVYLENVDGEFTAPIGESAYAISGTAIQGEEFVIEEITEEEETIQEEEPEAVAEEPAEEPAPQAQQIEEGLESVDIKIAGSYCIYANEKFTACQRTIWQGGAYAKGYFTGGEPLKKSPEQNENEFIYCQELEKPGKKAVNAYLFNEKGKTIKTHFGTIVECSEQTTTFDENEFLGTIQQDMISEAEVITGAAVTTTGTEGEEVHAEKVEVAKGVLANEVTTILPITDSTVRAGNAQSFEVVLNRPTKWSKKVILPATTDAISLNIPKEATKLDVKDEKGLAVVDYEVVDQAQAAVSGNLLTGNAVAEETNQALQVGDSENGEKEILVNEPVDEVTIEYELPGPTAREEQLSSNSKLVVVESEIHYTNVLAYTSVNNLQREKIFLHWIDNDAYISQQIYDYIDTNNDGLVNEIWWVVPSLSNQSYVVSSSGEQTNMAVQAVSCKNSLGTLCDGGYPAACGAVAGINDFLSCNDGNSETHGSNANLLAYTVASIYNSTFNGSTTTASCVRILDVLAITEWWHGAAGVPELCEVYVSNGSTWSLASNTCPGSTANPGITVYNVTANLTWTCGQFFNSTTITPKINVSTNRTSGGHQITVDILAFNITYENDTDAPNVSTLSELPDPLNQSQVIYINASIFDDTALETASLRLQVNFSNGTFTNYTVTAVGSNYYTASVPTTLVGNHSVRWFANDSFNKVNNTAIGLFGVITERLSPNVTNPTEFPDPVSFNHAAYVNVTVVDNHLIDNVSVQASFPNGTFTNYTATAVGSNYYNASIPTDQVGSISLRWFANDSNNNINNSITSSLSITDQITPNATSLTETPDPVEVNGAIELNVTCTDDVACNQGIVQLNWTNGTFTNYSAILNGTRFFNRSVPTNTTGVVSIRWAITDTAVNLNNTETSSFTVQDTRVPNVTSMTESPDPVNQSQTININATIVDNVGVHTVILQVNFSNGTFANYSTTAVGSNYFNASVPTTLIGNHSIKWFANDSAANVNSSEKSLFGVQTGDSAPPAVTSLTEFPDPVQYNNVIYVNATVTDTTSVSFVNVQANWSNGTFTNFTTTAVGSNYYNASISTNALGVVSLRWFANDTSNQVNNTEASSFTVQDTTKPNVTNILKTPNPVSPNATIELNTTVVDNVNVGTVLFIISWTNGTLANYSATLNGSVYFNRSITPSILGRQNFTTWANDSSNNINNTEITFFEVNDTTAPNVTSITKTPNPVSPNATIELNATVADNVNVGTVIFMITWTNGTLANYSATLNGTVYFNRSLVPSILGRQNFTVRANDTFGNTNSTETTFFEVNDTTAPNVTELTDFPDPVTQHKVIYVNATIVDNSNLSAVILGIKFPNNTYTNYTASLNGTNIYFNGSVQTNSTGKHDIRWFANDTSNAINNSETSSFTVNAPGANETEPRELNVVRSGGQQFRMSSDSMSGEFEAGKEAEYSVKISNDADFDRKFEASLSGLDNVLSLGEKSFTIPANSEYELKLNFIGDEPGDYTGRLVVNDNNLVRVSTIRAVVAARKETPLQLEVKYMENQRITCAGCELNFVISSDEAKGLARIKYAITDSDGNVIFRKYEIIAATELPHEKSLKLPGNMGDGQYALEVTLSSDGKTDVTEHKFIIENELREEKPSSEKIQWYAVALALLILAIFLIRKRKHRKSLIRKKHRKGK